MIQCIHAKEIFMRLKNKSLVLAATACLAITNCFTPNALLHADELLKDDSAATQPVALAPPATQPAITDAATQPAATHASISPEAQQILKQLHDAYADIKSLNVTGTLDAQLDIGGESRKEHADFTGSYQSPDKFRSEVKDQSLVGSTGETIYTYDPAKNVFTSTDAPKGKIDITSLGDDLTQQLEEQNPSLAWP